MAINPIIDTDDDGSGLVGTIRNNNWLQTINNSMNARWSLKQVTLTGSNNDININDANGFDADVIILNNVSDLTITGIAKPASPAKPGKILRLISIGAGNVFFKHQNASSSAANRLFNIATTGDTPISKGAVIYTYDDGVLSGTACWRLTAHEQGEWITPAYAGTDYTATAGTWTVDAGDVQALAYFLRGRQLSVQVELVSTTVSTTPAGLRRVIPGGFTANASFRVSQMALVNDNAGGFTPGEMQVVASATTMSFSKLSGNWAAATNNTSIFGFFTLAVQ